MRRQPPTVFFGSGPVAAQSLQLLSRSFPIEAVITKPATAQEMRRACPDAPVHTVSSRHEVDALVMAAAFESRYAVLVDFGIIVSQAVIDSFPLGIINSHFSLLPQWRGADPITFAILSGQEETGVSLMLLVEKMDEGPLLAQSPYAIPPTATTPTLTAALIELSDAMLQPTIPMYLQGEIVPLPQETASILPDKTPSYSRRLTKEDGSIDWTKPAMQLEREIRAFIGWPQSRTQLGGREIIITEARAAEHIGKPGEIVATGKRLLVGCGEGALEIVRLKPAGKSEMAVAAFLAGYRRLLG